MDDFTPPTSDYQKSTLAPGARPIIRHTHNPSLVSIPPELPPPPTNLPNGYRAVNDGTSIMSGRRGSLDDSVRSPMSPVARDSESPMSASTSPSTGATRFLGRSRSGRTSRSEVSTGVTPSGKKVLRKRKTRSTVAQEQEPLPSDGHIQDQPPVLPPPAPLARDDTRPDSMAFFNSAKASNFSRPYTASSSTSPPMPQLPGAFPIERGPSANSVTRIDLFPSPSPSPVMQNRVPVLSRQQSFPRVDPQHPTEPPPGFTQHDSSRQQSPLVPHSQSPSMPLPHHQSPTMSNLYARKTTSPTPDLALDTGRYIDPLTKSNGINAVLTSDENHHKSGHYSPLRIRRRKDPTPFNVLVVGATNSGKTQFIDFLRNTFPSPPERLASGLSPSTTPRMPHRQGSFTPTYLETELDGERVALTIWDSQGLERNVVDLQLRELVGFVETKFEETFAEEQKVARTPGVRDTHIHCVFLLLDPGRLDFDYRQSLKQVNGHAHPPANQYTGLDKELDTLILKGLAGKTTVIPIISKADTLTQGHLATLKRRAWHCIQDQGLDPLEPLGVGDSDSESAADSQDDEADDPPDAFNLRISPSATSTTLDRSDISGLDNSDVKSNVTGQTSSPRTKAASSTTTTSPPSRREMGTPAKPSQQHTAQVMIDDMYIPFSILSPDMHDRSVVGRKFAWGMADPYDSDHCDFVRLRESVFIDWRDEIRVASREKWYENWRTSRLKRTPHNSIRRPPGTTPLGIVPVVDAGTSPRLVNDDADLPHSRNPQSTDHAAMRDVSQPVSAKQRSPSHANSPAIGSPLAFAQQAS